MSITYVLYYRNIPSHVKPVQKQAQLGRNHQIPAQLRYIESMPGDRETTGKKRFCSLSRKRLI